MSEPDNQLDRIEGKVNQLAVDHAETKVRLWEAIEHLRHRASFWGAVSGALIAVAAKFTGCT